MQVVSDPHAQRVEEARRAFFGAGLVPTGSLSEVVLRSWERCGQLGLDVARSALDAVYTGPVLSEARERNRLLISHAEGIMAHVFEQIRATGSVVVLADAAGMLLESLGDPDFVQNAQRVALAPGALWDERQRGTNAIGTALAEQRPVEILGSEHFLERNGFLTCSCAPVFDPQGRIIGAFDISGDYRNPQRHSLGLVRLAVQLLEKRLFESEFGRELLISFHPRLDYVGSPQEGMIAVSPEGRVAGVTPVGLDLLGLRRVDVPRLDFSLLFETPLGMLLDRAGRDPQALIALDQRGGGRLYARVRMSAPLRVEAPRRVEPEAPALRRPARRSTAASPTEITLEALDTGDERLRLALQRAARVVGKDIPLLIHGESGAGKEMLARAFHNSGPRAEEPFVALNCAAIPENLIESELFGYTGGAFTGARKEGAAGKIQQAHGGTLFLDEIGDMPLAMQARLLRVLQERSVTPLGSSRPVQVDISLVCATHRNLREEVRAGRFREDLFYRVNGLTVTVPPLRERSDLAALARRILAVEAGERRLDISSGVMDFFCRYRWPGNIRQMHNAIRVAVALLDEGEERIEPVHLPEELFGIDNEADDMVSAPAPAVALPAGAAAGLPAAASAPLAAACSLDELERQAIARTLEETGGNVSAAARRLGISRNTLYRKLGRL